jgi:hypothetical protein
MWNDLIFVSKQAWWCTPAIPALRGKGRRIENCRINVCGLYVYHTAIRSLYSHYKKRVFMMLFYTEE